MSFRTVALSAVLIGLAGCSPEQAKPEVDQASTAHTQSANLEATLRNIDGEKLGIATISEMPAGLMLEVSVNNLSAGEKALHLHTIGQCDGPDFKSAGGHLNPTDVSHGTLSETGPHLGDFSNIDIGTDGSAKASIILAGTASDNFAHIQDSDGTAIMIHAGPDDYSSDPAGAAGPRIACGVFG